MACLMNTRQELDCCEAVNDTAVAESLCMKGLVNLSICGDTGFGAAGS